MADKKTKGRQKIDVTKRIDNDVARTVAFSKRKSGLFKKASELCTRCDIDLAVLVRSPSGVPFSFANLDIETITRRFLYSDQNPFGVSGTIDGSSEPLSQSEMKELEGKLVQLRLEVGVEIKKKKQLAERVKSHGSKLLCEKDIWDLTEVEAKELKAWLIELKEKININEESNFNYGFGSSVDPNAPSSSKGYEEFQADEMSNPYYGFGGFTDPDAPSSSHDNDGFQF